MARTRVVAHYADPLAQAAARRLLDAPLLTDSYAIGEIDEDAIPDLTAAGCVVQTLRSTTVADLGSGVEPIDMRVGATEPSAEGSGFAARRVPTSDVAAAAPSATDQPAVDYYLVGLDGPLLEERRAALAAAGARLIDRIPVDHYTARLTAAQAAAVAALPFVTSVVRYDETVTGPTRRVRAAARPPLPPSPGEGRAMRSYDILLHAAEDAPAVLQWLATIGVEVAGTSPRRIRIYLIDGDPHEDEIRARSEVALLQEYVPPRLHNDVARRLLAIDAPTARRKPPIDLTGEGEIVAIADTGIDVAHPDLAGRIAAVVARGRNGDASDPHGHGTHVAGSLAGDGTASGGAIRGTAPGARLFFQSILDESGGLGGLPVDLGQLFDEAYAAGARIHNDSWGSATISRYTLDASDVDTFVASHRDMLIVFSAGNDGQAADRLHSQLGFVDWLSIDSPASAKNALTVGASRSSRESGGYAPLTYGDVWPAEFPDGPIADAHVSGDAEGLAAFSSRGPCDDRRVKPEVVAPGTDIASTRSSLAPLRHFWGTYPGQQAYAFMGGTSMAAPLVAGCAALVREYFATARQQQPSAALVKATLVNGAHWLTSPDALAEHAIVPNYHQGFGRVDMASTVPNRSQPRLRLEYVDSWKDPTRQFGETGQAFRYTVKLRSGDWLRVCLAWTDAPARGLQNDLNLLVEHVPTHAKWLGNAQLPDSLGGADAENNVEVVRLHAPAPGEYRIQVSAWNLLHPGQDFALVVTGELDGSLKSSS